MEKMNIFQRIVSASAFRETSFVSRTLHVRLIKNSGHYNLNGVYRSFSEVPTKDLRYHDPQYAKAVSERLRTTRGQDDPSLPATALVLGEEALLPLMVAGLTLNRERPTSILEIGAGIGYRDEMIRKALASEFEFEYHFVALPWGGAGDSSGGSVWFHSLPRVITNPDIVYLRSVLTYVDNYEHVLNDVCQLEPSYVLLSKLPAGTFQTFASAETDDLGLTLAHWFFNIDEIVNIMALKQYSLIFRAQHEDAYDLFNLPSHLRMENDRAINILFQRNSDTAT